MKPEFYAQLLDALMLSIAGNLSEIDHRHLYKKKIPLENIRLTRGGASVSEFSRKSEDAKFFLKVGDRFGSGQAAIRLSFIIKSKGTGRTALEIEINESEIQFILNNLAERFPAQTTEIALKSCVAAQEALKKNAEKVSDTIHSTRDAIDNAIKSLQNVAKGMDEGDTDLENVIIQLKAVKSALR